MPTVIACLDATLRRLGGVPTYALTDNEKTVTAEHIARIAVRNPQIVDVGRHYGLTIRTCVPADSQTKGGSEATVRIAKAGVHERQLQRLARRSERDGTPDRHPLATQDDPAKYQPTQRCAA
jgi:transposase